MEDKEYRELLLLTAFSVMACDGDIDEQEEVPLIITLEKKESLFHLQNLEQRLNEMVLEINRDSTAFFKKFFNHLSKANLTFDQEKVLVDLAIKMIEADNITQYSELKFFKIIHSYLNITDEDIMKYFSHINDIEDYIAQDIISENYKEKLASDYFNSQSIPQFQLISGIDDKVLNTLKEKEDE